MLLVAFGGKIWEFYFTNVVVKMVGHRDRGYSCSILRDYCDYKFFSSESRIFSPIIAKHNYTFDFQWNEMLLVTQF